MDAINKMIDDNIRQAAEQERQAEENQRRLLDKYLNEAYRISDSALKFSEWSMNLGHKLAYFVISLQTVLAGYILYNSEKFSQIHSIANFYLCLGITVLVGLLWLTLYSLNIHNAGAYLAAKSEFDKWSVFRAITAPLPDDETYEKEFNKVTGNILQKGKKSLQRARSWVWVGLQLFLFFGFLGGTVFTFIWLVIIGFNFLGTPSSGINHN